MVLRRFQRRNSGSLGPGRPRLTDARPRRAGSVFYAGLRSAFTLRRRSVRRGGSVQQVGKARARKNRAPPVTPHSCVVEASRNAPIPSTAKTFRRRSQIRRKWLRSSVNAWLIQALKSNRPKVPKGGTTRWEGMIWSRTLKRCLCRNWQHWRQTWSAKLLLARSLRRGQMPFSMGMKSG